MKFLHSFFVECPYKLANFVGRKLQAIINSPVRQTSSAIRDTNTFANLPLSVRPMPAREAPNQNIVANLARQSQASINSPVHQTSSATRDINQSDLLHNCRKEADTIVALLIMMIFFLLVLVLLLLLLVLVILLSLCSLGFVL